MTAADPWVWRVGVTDELLVDGQRIHIVRKFGNDYEFIAGFEDDGRARISRTSPSVVATDHGLLLPNGVLDAIADYVKPGPPSDAVKRLEDALAHERRRVDQILDRLVRNPETP